MKDDSLPPIIKITDPIMASDFGCTLATKRTSAENTSDDRDALVIEPYANPFMVYPLVEDFEKFKALFEKGVACYIINTGEFLGKKLHQATHLAPLRLTSKTVLSLSHLHRLSILNMLRYLALRCLSRILFT